MKNKYLTEKERYYIEVQLKNKVPVKEIAKALDKHASTIYREIKKGTIVQRDWLLKEYTVYLADVGQRIQDENRNKKGRSLAISGDYELATFIEEKIINERFSPNAVCMYIKTNNIKFKISVSYKTIYNYIDKGYFQLLTNKHLPVKRKKTNRQKKVKVSLKNISARSIEERPQEVKKRNCFGHWELDTIIGTSLSTSKSCLLVLSERYTRREIIRKIPDKKASSVVAALNEIEKQYGKKFRKTFKTITCDNGVEFSDTYGMEKSIVGHTPRTTIYYCHPYCSSERGTNENINKMIRRWFPKGTSFENITNEEIQACENWVNNYPRSIFNGLSSNEFYIQNVQENKVI